MKLVKLKEEALNEIAIEEDELTKKYIKHIYKSIWAIERDKEEKINKLREILSLSYEQIVIKARDWKECF